MRASFSERPCAAQPGHTAKHGNGIGLPFRREMPPPRMRWNRLSRAARIAPLGGVTRCKRGAGGAYLLLTYSATAAISSSVIFSATTCITALSLVRSRLLKDLSWVWM